MLNKILATLFQIVVSLLLIAGVALTFVAVDTTNAHAMTLSSCPTLSIGSTGSYVHTLQTKLRMPASQVNGQFGSVTQTAVITFQKHTWPNDSRQWDGIVGPRTWAALGGCGSSAPSRPSSAPSRPSSAPSPCPSGSSPLYDSSNHKLIACIKLT
jgi:hypothetical protein